MTNDALLLRVLLIILVSGFAAPRGLFAETLDRKKAILVALTANPRIHAAARKWEAAKERAVQAGILEDPMIGFEFEGIPTDTVDAGKYNDIEWSFSQNFPFPGKLSLKRKAALEESRMALMEYLEWQRKITAGVKSAYAEFYMIHRTIEILNRNRILLEQFAAIAKAKYEVGKASQPDLLRAQVELAKVDNEIVIQKQAREAAVAKLNELVARTPEEPWADPVAVAENPADFPTERLLAAAVQNRPLLKSMESDIQRSEFSLKLARREYWPNFFTKIESRQFQGTGLEEYDVMFGINIPWLWTRSRVRAGTREAAAGLEAAKRQYAAEKLAVFFEIKDALVKVKTARSLVELYRTSIIPKAEQSVKISQTNYETEKIDFLALLDSQRSLLEFEIRYEESYSDYSKNLAELERLIGVDLESLGQGNTVLHEETEREPK